MKDLGELMKQAGAMQAKLKDAQERVAALEAEGVSGGGMVRAVMTGRGYLKAVAIDRSLMTPDDGEVVEDLVAAAVNDAKAKLDDLSKAEMKTLTEGLPLPPGMSLPF